MCDLSPLRNWLLAASAAIALSVASITVAAITNAGFFSAWQSPGWMLAAAASIGGAILALTQAKDALDKFCECTQSRCSGECSNMRNTINGALTVLGIEATACLTTALHAWIPFESQTIMWTIIGALTIQAALIISAIYFLAQLEKCAQRNTNKPPINPSHPFDRAPPIPK